MNPAEIESVIMGLPEDMREEVLDYIEFLKAKRKKRSKRSAGFKFEWEGGLKELKKEYTSVELQHKASEWR